MNKERLLILAALIEAQPFTSRRAKEGFYMNSILHECGTPSCIAGWGAWEALGRPERLYNAGYKLEMAAATWLGFKHFEEEFFTKSPAYELFYPDNDWFLYHGTPQMAANVLRHLAETGEVDWSQA